MINDYVNNGIISTSNLLNVLENKGSSESNIKTLDATYAPSGPLYGKDMFTEKHIDGAVYFDIDEIADENAPLPHTIPSAEKFETCVSALGINNNDFIIVYDRFGIHMAASRVWWMFRLFGHDNVCVLDGGLPCWEAAGYPVMSGDLIPPDPGTFKAEFRPDLVKQLTDMQEITESGSTTILDARATERFEGVVSESNPNIRPGHIPGSKNIPFMSLISENGCLKDEDFLKDVLAPYIELPLVTTCGSGVTACVLALALHRMGKEDVPVYDGSWTEWGHKNQSTKIERTV